VKHTSELNQVPQKATLYLGLADNTKQADSISDKMNVHIVTNNTHYTGGKSAEQYQRPGRLLDGSPQTRLQHLHGVLDTTRHVSCMYDLEKYIAIKC
jgi:hypothetical protein